MMQQCKQSRAAVGGLLVALMLLGLPLGCAGESTKSDNTDTVTGPQYDPSCADALRLTVQPLDIWGRKLPKSSLKVTDDASGSWTADDTSLEVTLSSASSLTISLSAPDFISAAVSVRWSGKIGEKEIELPPVDPTSGTRTALSVAALMVDGKLCPGATLFVGLDHVWFAASGRPMRRGNKLTLFRDGENYWGKVYTDLLGAQKSVHLATWWWQSNFELHRPKGTHATMGEIDRLPNTIFAVLEQLSGVRKRIMINQFAVDYSDGIAYLSTDGKIREKGRTTDDQFEVIVQPNRVTIGPNEIYPVFDLTIDLVGRLKENPQFADLPFVLEPTLLTQGLTVDLAVASYHQKPIVVDSRIAYVSGYNVKSTDWDTLDHSVFDARRMKFKSSVAERLLVQQKKQLPDIGPRKDYAMRIEGPSVQDVEDVLRKRWEQARRIGDLFADKTEPFPMTPYEGDGPGNITAQIVATMPPPFNEQSIFETLVKAVRQAKKYIYIEDQYFRVPMLDEVILAQMQKEQDLLLIVVTKPVTETDGGKKYTYLADKGYRDRFPERYLLLQFKAFDVVVDQTSGGPRGTAYFKDMDTHSKIMIVDDIYLSVGSANKNNRGLKYEGEINISVLDGPFVRQSRLEIFKHFVGPELADQVGDDIPALFSLLKATAETNAQKETWWLANITSMNQVDVDEAKKTQTPQGLIYPLSFTPDYFLEVGPDLY